MAVKQCCDAKPKGRWYRGTVEEPSTDDAKRNDYGEIDLTDDGNWDEYLADAWFAVKPMRGTEPMVSEQMTGLRTSTLTTRYSAAKAAIRPSMRIQIGSRTFHVAGPTIDVEEGHQWLEIPCVEEVAG